MTEPNAPDKNVVSIDKNKKPKKGYEQFMNVAAAFNHSRFSVLPAFHEKFLFVEYEDGTRIPAQLDTDNVLRPVNPAKPIEAIQRYASTDIAEKNFKFESRHSNETYKLAKSLAVPIPYKMIKAVATKSDRAYCWHRLPFDLSGGDTPTFNEILSRCSAPRVLQAYIGSLFFEQAERQQYLWITGEGKNSKSRLAALLRWCMGSSYRAETVPDRGSQRFWSAGVLNKRLIVLDDCSNYSFPASGFFKALTGSETTRIEHKGIDCFDAEITCKFMFLSNEMPEIGHNVAEMRRALFMELGPIEGPEIPTHVYDKMLRDEAAHILHACMEVYLDMCPNHGSIPNSETMGSLSDSIAETEEHLLTMIEEKWDINREMKAWMTEPSVFAAWLSGLKIPRYEEKKLRKMLKNRFGISSKVTRIGTATPRMYVGMKPKGAYHVDLG